MFRRYLLLIIIPLLSMLIVFVPSASAAPASPRSADVNQPADPAAIDQTTLMTNEVVRLTNIEREKVGCGDLVINPQLTQAAQAHNDDMVAHDLFSHTGSDGSSPWDRMHATGYQFSAAAENIAADFTTPADVVQGWMDSPTHRANMLNCDLHEIGVGYGVEHTDIDIPFWTQDFGTQA